MQNCSLHRRSNLAHPRVLAAAAVVDRSSRLLRILKTLPQMLIKDRSNSRPPLLRKTVMRSNSHPSLKLNLNNSRDTNRLSSSLLPLSHLLSNRSNPLGSHNPLSKRGRLLRLNRISLVTNLLSSRLLLLRHLLLNRSNPLDSHSPHSRRDNLLRLNRISLVTNRPSHKLLLNLQPSPSRSLSSRQGNQGNPASPVCRDKRHRIQDRQYSKANRGNLHKRVSQAKLGQQASLGRQDKILMLRARTILSAMLLLLRRK
jgi:hypothetical protein